MPAGLYTGPGDRAKAPSFTRPFFFLFDGKPMSRASIVLIVIVLAIVAALVWLSHRSVGVTPHHIEQVVTSNGAADGTH